MNETPEQLDKMIEQTKSAANFGMPYKKNNSTISLIETLNNIPRKNIPAANFERVKLQILERLSAKSTAQTQSLLAPANSFLSSLPRFLKISASAVASLLIFTSLTVGAAVAALQAVPGDAIYPLKKVVENIQLQLTNDQGAKANLQIKFAQNRIEELEQVLETNQNGKLSEEEVQKIVTEAVKNIQQTTAAAITANANTNSPKATIVNKLADINSKLKTASIHAEGEIKLELEKALAENQITQEQAIENIERAGLKVEEKPLSIDDKSNLVTTQGKLTLVNKTSVNIGTARFLLTKDTKYVNITLEELGVDQVVKIEGEVKDNKIYAIKITLENQPQTESPAADTMEVQQ